LQYDIFIWPESHVSKYGTIQGGGNILGVRVNLEKANNVYVGQTWKRIPVGQS